MDGFLVEQLLQILDFHIIFMLTEAELFLLLVQLYFEDVVFDHSDAPLADTNERGLPDATYDLCALRTRKACLPKQAVGVDPCSVDSTPAVNQNAMLVIRENIVDFLGFLQEVFGEILVF